MTLLAAIAVLLTGKAAWAGNAGQLPKRVVTVCLDPGGPAAIIYQGQAVATQIFRQAGIRLEWRDTERPCLVTGAGIVVTLAVGTPRDQHPGALAYAMPYGAAHVVLLYDRVLDAECPAAVPRLLGYVLAHEIAHILQGVRKHSDRGIMKPHWDARDHTDMQLGRLNFTDEDIVLMRRALDGPRGARGEEREIAIGLANAQVVPFAVLARAKLTAERIYAGIGVKLKWRIDDRAPISVQFDAGVAAGTYPGAIGYAMPYASGGTCIHVLFDRLSDAGPQRIAGVLLGHVMAHELGHVLEGCDRHSGSGLMKARWDAGDIQEMVFRPLSFSTADAESIQSAVAGRARSAHP